MEKKQNDSLALIVGGLFILALVFATYNYFNKGKSSNDAIEKRIQELQKLDKVKTTKEETPVVENTTGDINGNGVSVTALTPAVAGPEWVANDYNKGDIHGDSYTVKSGDTLWEIAEAVYGDGAQWVKLLEVNKGSIGFLPNGQQALIIPGQVLNIAQ